MNESQLRAANNDGMDPFWKTDHIPSVETPNLIKRLEDEISRLKAKLREVPWTEEELKDQIQFLTGYVRASNGILNSGKIWEYGVEGGAKYLALWAEKRIKERG